MPDSKRLLIDPSLGLPPTRTQPTKSHPTSLPPPKSIKAHPWTQSHGQENGKLYFVGNATTLIEWHGIRIMTDPNFLHAGDHVHLGPGVSAQRVKDPAVGLEELPRVDLVCLSHYHEDHFDKVVEDSLRRDLPIISTAHAKQCLSTKPGDEAFTNVHAVDTFNTLTVDIVSKSGVDSLTRKPCIKVTAMPGKHVPPGPANLLAKANDLLGAVPPTNGWMLELGTESLSDERDWKCGYRVYISGDTLIVDELKEIPERYKGKQIDLMLVHLGGTSIPSAALPLVMVTMDGRQGVELMKMIDPDVTVPIHMDDYDVFKSPPEDFKKHLEEARLQDKVVWLDRGDIYSFTVRE